MTDFYDHPPIAPGERILRAEWAQHIGHHLTCMPVHSSMEDGKATNVWAVEVICRECGTDGHGSVFIFED